MQWIKLTDTEVCKHATYWAAPPSSTALPPTRQQQGNLLELLADIKRFDIQNLSLDLPQDIRARIERALIGWSDLAAEQQKESDSAGDV